MKGLYICTCSGVEEKSKTSFKILFPKEELPKIYKGKDAIRDVAQANPNTNLSSYLGAIAKTNGKFAYYIASDDNGNVIENYNLLTGKRLA